MRTLQIYDILNEKFPLSYRCEWDNDGIMLLPSNDHETKKALLCLDVTHEAVSEAIKTGADCIISHHPFIFRGMKSISTENASGREAVRLIKNNIAVMSFHTRMDAADGGINTCLAKLLGLKDVAVFECGGEKICRRGRLDEPVSFESFLSDVTKKLGAKGTAYVKGKTAVRNVVLAGGSYDEGVFAAEAAGADIFLSGELKYHTMLEAKENGFSVIAAGHYFTEKIAVDCFAEALNETKIELEAHYGSSPISYTEV